MEGFGNYDPDADVRRAPGVMEKGVAALVNLGEYVPEAWKNKLGLYDAPKSNAAAGGFGHFEGGSVEGPSRPRARQNTIPTFSGGSTYSSGSFNFSSYRTPPREFREDVTTRAAGTNHTTDSGFAPVSSGDPPEKRLGSRGFSPVMVGEYEARLVKRIVQPRGGRLQPSANELLAFKRDVAGLDLECILTNVKSYICGDELTWQWKIRALAVLQSLAAADKSSASSPVSLKVVQWVRGEDELISALKEMRQRQCQNLAQTLLERAGVLQNTAGSRSTPPSGSCVDLLDAETLAEPIEGGGGVETAPKEHAVVVVGQRGNYPGVKPSLLDDLF